MHYEMEQEEHDVYPDDPDFDINNARLVKMCIRDRLIRIAILI